MNEAARKLTAGMCLVASALLAGSMVRDLLTLDGLGLPVSVADTAGAIVWLANCVERAGVYGLGQGTLPHKDIGEDALLRLTRQTVGLPTVASWSVPWRQASSRDIDGDRSGNHIARVCLPTRGPLLRAHM